MTEFDEKAAREWADNFVDTLLCDRLGSLNDLKPALAAAVLALVREQAKSLDGFGADDYEEY